jgi:hypothetical protein
MTNRDIGEGQVRAFEKLGQVRSEQGAISPADVVGYTHAMLLGLISINRTAGNFLLAHMLELALAETDLLIKNAPLVNGADSIAPHS